MIDWQCNSCEFIAKINRVFSRHATKCSKRYKTLAEMISRKKLRIFELENSIVLVTITLKDLTSKKSVTVMQDERDDWEKKTEKLDSNERNTMIQDESWSVHSSSSTREFEKFSTCAIIKTKIFQDVTSKRADDSLSIDYQSREKHAFDHAKIMYFSFHNETNYVIAQWFSKTNNTKDDVNNFFDDLRLESLWQYVSFKSDAIWMNMLNFMKNDILNDAWSETTIEIESNIEDFQSNRYFIYYRDVMKIIEFLVEHRSFVKNLAYVSIRKYAIDDLNNVDITKVDSRIWIEMHTTDWWWRTQTQLLDNVIVVSILLTTNKTLLTNLVENLSLWSIYLIIENLNEKTRRQRNRFCIILLNLIFISKESSRAIKFEIYHTTLKLMLVRELISFSFELLINWCVQLLQSWSNTQ